MSLGSTEKKQQQQLVQMLNSVLHAPQYENEFKCLMKQLSVTEDDVLQEFLKYNLDLDAAEGNEVYQSMANRVVLHAHNLVLGSWHILRQQAVVDFLNVIGPARVVDVGFGVPSQYVRELALNKKLFHLTFCDCYNAAFIFAAALLESWCADHWRRQVSFKPHDMNSLEYLGDFDAYLLLDSVEHAEQPEVYLKEQVRQAPSHAYFMLSLPVGPLIARHHIFWETDLDARQWLGRCGLFVCYERAMYVNPQVDLFAETLGAEYHDILFLCRKMDGGQL